MVDRTKKPVTRDVEHEPFDLIMAGLSHRGLYFSPEVVSNYLLGLQAKRFVILSGISGTGKTRLAMEVARHFQTADTANLCVVAVHPDWTDSRGLLGYYNPLLNRYSATPFLELAMNAEAEWAAAERDGRPATPYFAVFDEMNLARVEQYFADVLSAMESGQRIYLHSEPDTPGALLSVPNTFGIPPNLHLVGTVNVDESTYMFSPKVLDRAFTIELSDVDLRAYTDNVVESSDDSGLRLKRIPRFLDPGPKPSRDDWSRFGGHDGGALQQAVMALNDALGASQRHFGYRVANEIARFVNLAHEQAGGGLEPAWAALDLAILQKALPKMHGTQSDLTDALQQTVLFSVDPGSSAAAGNYAERIDGWVVERGRLVTRTGIPARLPRTGGKAWLMLDRLNRQGFTSFI